MFSGKHATNKWRSDSDRLCGGQAETLLLPDPLIPLRLLRMSLASCKVFRPFLAASSARALAASARARSWSAVCKCMVGQRTNLSGLAFPSSRQAPHSHSLETEADTEAARKTRLTFESFKLLPPEMRPVANQTNLLLSFSLL